MAANTIDPSVISALQGPGGAPTQGSSEDLRNNFMTLLVTQLKNQDPLNPMENAEMTSQLAQINTVGGIDSLNETLRGITSQIESGQSLQAAALIGKEVLVPGDRVLVGDEGQSTPFGVELKHPADRVEVSIYNGAGELISRDDRGPMEPGVETFAWDGLLDNGDPAPSGAYTVEVKAWNANGEPLEAEALNYALVSGISNDPHDGLRLDLGGIAEPVRLDQIRQIL